MFAYKVGGSKKGPKHAYVIYEWSLMHTTTCDQHWGGNESQKQVLVKVAWPGHASWTPGV